MQRVRDIALKKLADDPALAHKSQDDAVKEILQELDRYPIVDRAVEQFTYLKSPELKAAVQKSLKDSMSPLSPSTSR